jgi:predicted xylose isomerase-like sugar epimerase
MVATAQVELREEAWAVELIQQLVNHRNWKLVLDNLEVEGIVIHAETPWLVLILHEEH